ncbi:MAG: hypothetical protein H6551_09660 [Chitinophagales bacterium]|nr:hypothetical protein [Chitinophagaceae bacterium]MCB9065390.1 hypothetical protein [Chitinophagales bacterium]
MSIQIASGQIDITPKRPAPLFGFAERNGDFSKVHDSLEVNLTVIKQDGTLVFLYSVDTLFVPHDMVDAVVKEYGNEFGFEGKDVWMMASHTHFAPALDKTKPGLGMFNEDYYNQTLQSILELTKQVLETSFKTVTIEYGTGRSKLNVNRRKKLLRPGGQLGLFWKTLIYPDHEGAKDDTIHFLKFIDDDGNLEAVLWNYACHPVGFANRNEASAEFPGLIRERIRTSTNNETLPVLFTIGFAGDIKPDVTAVTHTKWRDRIGYFFQLGPVYTKFPNMEYYTQWVDKLWGECSEALNNTKASNTRNVTNSQVAISLSDVIGADSDKKIYFKKLSLSDTLQIIGISEEVLIGYKPIVQEALNSSSINIGCLAGTHIYLPTDKNIKEGGYEVDLFKERFGVNGEFKTGLNELIRKTIKSL